MSQIMVRETKKVIQSVQLIIFHQMMPHSNTKAIWRSSFACFRVFGTLVLFGARGPSMTQIPQMMVREVQKVVQTLQLIISHQMMHYSNPKAIWRSSFTCFRVFGALVQFGETGPKYGPNTANHCYRDTKSNPKYSAHHFTSNDALLKCKNHVKVQFDLF